MSVVGGRDSYRRAANSILSVRVKSQNQEKLGIGTGRAPGLQQLGQALEDCRY